MASNQTELNLKKRGRPMIHGSVSAKKRAKKEKDRERQVARVNLGSQVGRWQKVMQELGLKKT